VSLLALADAMEKDRERVNNRLDAVTCGAKTFACSAIMQLESQIRVLSLNCWSARISNHLALNYLDDREPAGA